MYIWLFSDLEKLWSSFRVSRNLKLIEEINRSINTQVECVICILRLRFDLRIYGLRPKFQEITDHLKMCHSSSIWERQ
jgi:hypothetical protein